MAEDLSKSLLVVYHSMTGGTRQMAQALCDGAAQEGGVAVRLLHASQAHAADVLAADGLVFATPENLAAMSGQLKDFFDRLAAGAARGESFTKKDSGIASARIYKINAKISFLENIIWTDGTAFKH